MGVMIWKMLGATAGLALVLTGCEVGTDHRPELTAKVVKKQIADRYKDPESVLFRKIKIDAEGKHLCGELNAKNGFGAYTGYEIFRAEINGAGSQVKVVSFLTMKESIAKIQEGVTAGEIKTPSKAIFQNALNMVCSPDIQDSSKPGPYTIAD